ncbi:hypothetical protein D9C73_028389 [Collichthys lucidus]|uniref:Uncharacterized protein n=1 Tax=Collichthys lucidus TaxID=240159 RepID=A0A4U5TWL1_COLLU|nr:hypothetical protein D9C73_028389 [Collichthys lucidus]
MSKVQRLLQQGHDEWYVERRDLYHTLLYEAHTAGSASSQKGILSFARAAATYTPLIAPSPLPSARVLRRAHLIMEIEKMPMYRHQLLSVTGEILCIDGTRKALKKIYGDGQGTMQYVTSVLNELGQFVTTAVVVAAAAESEGCYACMPTEEPAIYLQERTLFSPVLVFDGSRCLLAIGNTPISDRLNAVSMSKVQRLLQQGHDEWYVERRDLYHTLLYEAHTAGSASSQKGILSFARAAATYTPLIAPSPLPSARVLRRAHLIMEIEKMPMYRHQLLSVTGEILCIDGTRKALKKIYGDGQGTMQYVTSVLNEWGQFVTTAVVVAAAAESEGCYACMARGLIARFRRANAPGVQLYVSVKVVVLNGVWLNKYRCRRGSNYLEGLHAHLFNAFGEPTEEPAIYLQERTLFSPVLVFDGSRCLLAIGNTPVTTFAKEELGEGGLNWVLVVAGLVGVEAGLAEEDAGEDALCVADDVDGVYETTVVVLVKANFEESGALSFTCKISAGSSGLFFFTVPTMTISGLIAGSVHSSKKKNTNISIQAFLIHVFPHVAMDFFPFKVLKKLYGDGQGTMQLDVGGCGSEADGGSSTNQMTGGSIPGSSGLHVEVSLGKTLNPKIAPEGCAIGV